MRKRLLLRGLISFFLVVLLTSCQLLGGSTQVSFLNNTAFAFAAVQFGPLIIGGLDPSSQSGSFSIPPGQNPLSAESQGGSWTDAVLLSIAAGHSYLVTFNPAATFPQITVSLTATN